MVTGLFACLHIPLKVGSSSLLVKISYFVLIRKIVMFKNWLIFTGIFIEMGVIEIEYEFNKINVFTKSDEEPHIPGIGGTMATGLSTIEPNACCKLALCPPSLSSRCISVLFLSFIYSCFCLYCLCVGCFKNFIGKGFKKNPSRGKYESSFAIYGLFVGLCKLQMCLHLWVGFILSYPKIQTKILI